ncbi:MAG: exodeoxyribonuclease VII large subunit [Planctomycetes bacterium]|nr:exodeoxyribonuclease VII large subunit [Planctomycetota bacterium]
MSAAIPEGFPQAYPQESLRSSWGLVPDFMLPSAPTNVKPQTISAVTAQIKTVLETTFNSVWALGEISSLSVAGSGHVYFTLKDKAAQLPSVMWRTTAQRHRYAMKDGIEVVVRGKLTVYPPHGKYQLTVDELYQSGVGAQDLALQKLKEKLQKLGYFAPERKRPLPAFPRRIALVTSPTGAAIRDMLEIITRRWPCAEIWICGVRVQGVGAREDIAAALDRLNDLDDIDVILLGRGGGSSEDLAAFNEEMVAQAIFNAKAPVISAVGHEIDVTIADLVADFRAATPSEAAERATPDRLDLARQLKSRQQRLHDLLLRKYQAQKQWLDNLAKRRVFVVPLDRLRNLERNLDDSLERMQRALHMRLTKARLGLEARAGRLESLSPLNVLARGYSLTRTLPAKTVVRGIEQVNVGDAVEIIIGNGRLKADVTGKTAGEE